MKLCKEMNLNNFDFWSGAEDTASYLTESEFSQIESVLTELYPEGMDETTVNDIFWFEEDAIAEWLGYESFEDVMNRK